MPPKPKKISPFKPHLLGGDAGYQGGKPMDEVKSKSDKLYKLSSNENPIGPSPLAMKAVAENVQNLHIYPDRTPIRLQQALSSFPYMADIHSTLFNDN